MVRTPAPATDSRRPSRAFVAPLVAGVLVAAVAAALGLMRGSAFWSTSDGVYALTARELLHGLGLYGDVAAAQPPLVYLYGAGALALDDSLTMLRAGLELAVLATGLLVWLAVKRLTGRPWLAVAAAVLSPLTPIALHENALLTPETLGAPVLLGMALLAATPGRSRAEVAHSSFFATSCLAGAVGAVAVAIKLSFLLPVAAIVLVSPQRRGVLAWLAGGIAVLAVAATAVWGTSLWGNVVVAQQQTGLTPLHDLAGFVAQAGWNELPLVVAAAAAWLLRSHARDPVLLRTLLASGIAGLLLILSDIKLGSYVNTVHVAEPPLLILGVCSVAWLVEAGRARSMAVAVAVGAAVLLGVAQSGSALLHPADPRPYTRPFAESGPRRLLSDGQVRAAVRAARACPSASPYPGIQFIAFVAHRRVAGDQPDRFILASRYHRSRVLRALRDRVPCPAGAPADDARALSPGD